MLPKTLPLIVLILLLAAAFVATAIFVSRPSHFVNITYPTGDSEWRALPYEKLEVAKTFIDDDDAEFVDITPLAIEDLYEGNIRIIYEFSVSGLVFLIDSDSVWSIGGGGRLNGTPALRSLVVGDFNHDGEQDFLLRIDSMSGSRVKYQLSVFTENGSVADVFFGGSIEAS